MNASLNGSIGDVEGPVQNKRSRYFDRNSIFIYSSHFLSSFGDRIWQFAVGLYLYYLYPCSLTLTAVYGLSTCGSLFILGAPVGRWVDKSKRLKAARITILIQNAAVVISATIMASSIYYKKDITSIWNGRLETVIYATIIIVEIIAELASMANKLVLEKDWIVVLAGGDEKKLSYLNATMRTINLTCKILAPFVVGHLLEWFSYVTGAIFIASWNVVSAFAEFYLLQIIFSVVPELAMKNKNGSRPSSQNMPSVQINTLVASPFAGGDSKGNENSTDENPPVAKMCSTSATSKSIGGRPPGVSGGTGNDSINNNNTNNNDDFQSLGLEFQEISLNTPKSSRANNCARNNESSSTSPGNGENNNGKGEREGRFCKFWDGWKIYFSHPVKFAGLALASLYMTVLCFDNVIIAYLSSQGVSASLSGNATAIAALFGILGSLSFPFVRRKLGRNKAGIFGFTLETLCLLLCVLSILAPGSPFRPTSLGKIFSLTSSCQNENVVEKSLSLQEHWDKHSNVFLLVAGIVLARYGLWIADLSVTQIFQERVHESERGVMGGVQGSLNQLMSLVKFCLTIILPYPETFGYLICLSWLFVFLGWIFFMIFMVKSGKRTNVVDTEKTALSKSKHVMK